MFLKLYIAFRESKLNIQLNLLANQYFEIDEILLILSIRFNLLIKNEKLLRIICKFFLRIVCHIRFIRIKNKYK